MRCLYPIPIRDSYGVVHSVPCGKCQNCLSNKRSELAFRIGKDVEDMRTCVFVTLTYSDENLEYDVEVGDKRYNFGLPSVSKVTARNFLKRLRKFLDTGNYKINVYLTAEYGDTTRRPHYHAIIYDNNTNLPLDVLCDGIRSSWTFGNISIDSVTPASINYVAKHQAKKCTGLVQQAPIFHIRSPGIGKSWLTEKHINFS